MKTLFLFCSLFASIWAEPNFSAVIAALKQGNTTTLAQYFDESVELTLADNEGTYNKADATKMVSQFFTSQKPSDCAMVHNGAARDGSSYYCIGTLTAGGKKYRMNIFFGAKNLIQEMRFEVE